MLLSLLNSKKVSRDFVKQKQNLFLFKMDRNPIKLLKADYSTIELATLFAAIKTNIQKNYTSLRLHCQYNQVVLKSTFFYLYNIQFQFMFIQKSFKWYTYEQKIFAKISIQNFFK